MVMDKLNLQIVLPGEFVTEAAQSGDQTQRVQLVWVKLMGQVVKLDEISADTFVMLCSCCRILEESRLVSCATCSRLIWRSAIR